MKNDIWLNTFETIAKDPLQEHVRQTVVSFIRFPPHIQCMFFLSTKNIHLNCIGYISLFLVLDNLAMLYLADCVFT